MRDATIARNYAQALITLANQGNSVETFGGLINGMADAVRENAVLRRFLAAPQIAEADKRAVLRKAFEGRAPNLFVLFVEKLVSNRRQMLIPEIAIEYVSLVDQQAGRVHATVTIAHQPKDGEADDLSKRLSAALGKSVVAHLLVNPAILGGLIVRVGDSVMDGSVRRRLGALRSALVSGGR